jgi:hypothetical protein
MSPIALSDLALDRLAAFLRLALRALALLGPSLGVDALALNLMRLLACRDLRLPISSGIRGRYKVGSPWRWRGRRPCQDGSGIAQKGR